MRKIVLLFVVLITCILFGCGQNIFTSTKNNRELVIYSDLNSGFIKALTEGFTKEHNIGLNIMKLDELDGTKQQADLVLTSHVVLKQLASAGAFEKLNLPALENLPKEYKDSQDYWAGLLFDSFVIVANKEYVRKHGQAQLSGWRDLLQLDKCRIVTEHFDNSDLQRQILAVFASKMGREEAIDYFAALEDKVVQHSKFSFTPLRMLASGDADIAITLKSYVYEFAEDDFPAQMIEPEEGTPAVIYGVAIYKGSASLQESKILAQWLLSSPSVRKISFKEETGFNFVMPKGIPGPLVNSETLWFNNGYLEKKELKDLVQEWYEKVRFRGLF